MKTTVISFANNKGGSGKSTTCSNVGCALGASGKKVLLIDGDMQLNLSLSYFDEDRVFELASGEKNIFRAMQGRVKLEECIVPTQCENVDIIPSSTLMSGIEFELFPKMQREFLLRKALAPIKKAGRYDYILVDAPPTLGTWVINILAASDKVIIPVEASPWGLFGLANMFEFVEEIRGIAPELEILGITVTKVSERKNYFKQTMQTLAESGTFVFPTYVRVDVNIEKAQDVSLPVTVFNPKSRSAQEFTQLAKEIDARCR
ncbi:MAG: ParA family protein [Clostridia bacterium]|jgi:chromosome partitioning protein|nr:ParA family protein [Clostridia bacterium]MBP5666038.1 ParA family protein [Clostridia bacterium]MBP5765748.1 ParA family protein [Clostridia bacterium]MBR5006195.1 ParA family protein [Clostridia bacterium]